MTGRCLPVPLSSACSHSSSPWSNPTDPTLEGATPQPLHASSPRREAQPLANLGSRSPRGLALPGRQPRLGLLHHLLSSPLQCDDVVSGLSPSQAILGDLKPPQRQNLTTFLRLVGCRVQGGQPAPEGVVSDQQLFFTAYFLVSALAGTAPGLLLLLCSRFASCGGDWHTRPPFSGGQGERRRVVEVCMVA